MRKTTLFLLTILSLTIHAQNYTFSNLSGTYADLTGTTSLNNGEIWDEEEYNLTLPFALTINGNTSAAITLFNGVGIQLLSTDELSYGIAALSTDLQDRGSTGTTSLSPISYKIDGAVGSRILKIECKNCGSWTDVNKTMFVNFQTWIYEGANIIEYRYGPSLVNNPDVFYGGETGAAIGIANEDMDGNLFNTHLLSGAAANPTLSTVNSLVNITGTPGANKIFRFTPTTLNTSEINTNNVSFYPNPFKDSIFVQGVDQPFDYAIYDLQGKVIQSTNQHYSATKINTERIASGVYFLKISSNDTTITKKIIKM